MTYYQKPWKTKQFFLLQIIALSSDLLWSMYHKSEKKYCHQMEANNNYYLFTKSCQVSEDKLVWIWLEGFDTGWWKINKYLLACSKGAAFISSINIHSDFASTLDFSTTVQIFFQETRLTNLSRPHISDKIPTQNENFWSKIGCSIKSMTWHWNINVGENSICQNLFPFQ